MTMGDENKPRKPQVSVFPFPLQGHINPVLQFAKRLASKGVKATLVTTVFLSKSWFSDAYIDLQTVSDASMNAAIMVSQRRGLPADVLGTYSAATQLPLNSTVSLPGLPPLQVSELPSFISDNGSSPAWFDVIVNQFSNVDGADWVFFNTFYELEKEVLDCMSSFWNVWTIGPTVPSIRQAEGLSRVRPFGSLASLEVEQMEELVWGLKAAGCNFLWETAEKAKLPSRFIEETREKGLVVTWCHQLEVLSQESISCFLSHCGLNSILETLSLGVPVLAMPLWTDQNQIMNAKQVDDVWGIGIKARQNAKGLVIRDMIEQCLMELVKGEKGKEAKKNAIKWKNLAKNEKCNGRRWKFR
ncbi:Detected protein of unknown function [Hibiscus syriacus]|uniref:Uncharacterized protein n=1 Tax=Hibiscus syriacus TaxID=106335 RepID=A0A6A3AUW3_HIBSY|nr:Detected protein of unknown function [Hibiscus syriacus]